MNNSTMKTKRTLLILLFVLSVSISRAQENVLIIGKDQSDSMKPTELHQTQENTVLRQHLIDRIQKPGDVVVLSYLYRNTASVSNERVFKWAFSQRSQNGKYDKLQQAQQRSKLLKSKLSFINTVIQEVSKPQPISDETRILAITPRIHHWLGQAHKVEVLFLSDMIEYSPRRKLIQLSSKGQAQNLGVHDAQKLVQDFGLNSLAHREVTVHCYLPVSMMDTRSTFQYVQYYWQTVFTTLFLGSTTQFHTL